MNSRPTVRKQLALALIFLCLVPILGAARGASAASSLIVTGIVLSPRTPNILSINQSVNLTFNYTTTEAGGVRIFARPFAGGALAPGYAASGSPLYPMGSGSGSGFFTITSGNVTVDRIRFQMWNADQSRLLREDFIPVHYQFTSAANRVVGIALNPPTPNSLRFNQDVSLTFNYTTTEAGGARIFARPFAGGALAPSYAASGSPLYPVGSGGGNGSFTITAGDVTVDRIRFQMWNANQTTLLFEAFVPVYYQFGHDSHTLYLPLITR